MIGARTVRPIHFEDLVSGAEFEPLVFACHLCEGWTDLAWFGQTGSDQGRDIIGLHPFDDRPAGHTVIQCVNRDSLSQAKAENDMAAAVNDPWSPNRLIRNAVTRAFCFGWRSGWPRRGRYAQTPIG